MRDRANDIANAASNTCTWLFEDEKYLEWSNQRHGLLWIKGHPGVGKSTLMKHAAEGLKSREDTIFASFFFYGGGSLIQKSTLGLFRSLLHQVIQQVPSLLQELTHTFIKRCQTDGDYGEKWTWHERELQNFFGSAVVEAAKTNTTRIFVDALDECGEQTATSLVSFFEGIADYLSICFSCRYYPLIALEKGLEICVEDENAQDIASFVCHELNRRNYDSIRDQIIQRSAGNFQWANLVVSLVLNLVKRGSPPRVIQRKIQQIPQELSRLYEELLKSIPDDDIQDSLLLMQWIYFGMRPLSLEELRFAMAVDASPSSTTISQCQGTEHYVETDEAMERRVRDLSKGLAEPVNHEGQLVVQFIHQSVIDFLDNGALQLLDKSQGGATADTLAGRSHFRLSKTCIRYLAMEEVKQWFGQIRKEYLITSPRIALEDYSFTFWTEHVIQCETNDLSAGQLLSYCDSLGLLDFYFDYWHDYNPRFYVFHWPIMMLHIASTCNLPRALNDFLSQGVMADSRDGFGRTPLSWTAGEGHETIVRMLLERDDVNPDSTDENGQTPLSWASENGHEAVVRILLERDDVNPDSADKIGQTPLSWAARKGHETVVRMLLERDDVNPDSADESGPTLLSWVVIQGYETIVRMLLERDDIKADSKDSEGITPLSYAARAGHEGTVRLLLERHDVDVNSRNKWGKTPLRYAAQAGRKGIVRLLLERDDVDVNSKDHNGETALDYATRKGHEGIIKLLEEHSR